MIHDQSCRPSFLLTLSRRLSLSFAHPFLLFRENFKTPARQQELFSCGVCERERERKRGGFVVRFSFSLRASSKRWKSRRKCPSVCASAALGPLGNDELVMRMQPLLCQIERVWWGGATRFNWVNPQCWLWRFYSPAWYSRSLSACALASQGFSGTHTHCSQRATQHERKENDAAGQKRPLCCAPAASAHHQQLKRAHQSTIAHHRPPLLRRPSLQQKLWRVIKNAKFQSTRMKSTTNADELQ